MGNAPSQSNVAAGPQSDAINRAADAAAARQQQQQLKGAPHHHQPRSYHPGMAAQVQSNGPPNISNAPSTTTGSTTSSNTSAVRKNNSDMSISANSISSIDGIKDNSNAPSAPSPGKKQQLIGTEMIELIDEEDESVPTVFRWEHGGRQVYITGTFNGWSRQIPMHRSGNDFTYIHNLKKGKHAFKFIVDDEWRFAPDQPTVADIEGRINNFIDVSDFKPYTGDKNFEEKSDRGAAESAAAPAAAGSESSDNISGGGVGTNAENFSHSMPDLDEYTKEPPPLPPHLRHIILNKAPQLQDTAALPVPQHVALNHLYCTAIKDNMMVLGITQRHKTKFVTTVYYSPCS